MKIGILIKDFNSLENWELRIINEIHKSDWMELSLLLQDGRENIKTTKGKLQRLINSGNIFGKLLFRAQTFIEKKFFFKPKPTVNKDSIIEYLKTIPSIKLFPERKGYLDIFSKEDAETIKKYNLDLILRHEFNIIRGEILTAAKYGIWSFHHGDNAVNRGLPAGFWEIMHKSPVIGVTLQKLTQELDGGLVIDKGFYNRHWSYVRNNTFILEHSVELLFKNIRQLHLGFFNPKKSPVYYNMLFREPTFFVTLKYMLGFGSNLIKIFWKRIRAKLLGTRYSCWTLFLGKGNFLDATLYRLKSVELPKSEFWADPFLFTYNNQDYIFFENFSYKKQHGKISCGKVINNRIVDVVDVMDFDYHLSYPFIVEEDGEIFMIPECYKNNRVEVYRCTHFPTEWQLYSTAFQGESVADVTYFKDDAGQKWLFLNKGIMDEHCSELYIYKIDSLQLKELTPHRQNPVIIDSRIARNAGALFKHEGKWIRPSQNNSNGIYGYGLNLNEITELSLDCYEEKKFMEIHPNFKKGLISCHHLHQTNGKFVIDGAFKKM